MQFRIHNDATNQYETFDTADHPIIVEVFGGAENILEAAFLRKALDNFQLSDLSGRVINCSLEPLYVGGTAEVYDPKSYRDALKAIVKAPVGDEILAIVSLATVENAERLQFCPETDRMSDIILAAQKQGATTLILTCEEGSVETEEAFGGINIANMPGVVYRKTGIQALDNGDGIRYYYGTSAFLEDLMNISWCFSLQKKLRLVDFIASGDNLTGRYMTLSDLDSCMKYVPDEHCVGYYQITTRQEIQEGIRNRLLYGIRASTRQLVSQVDNLPASIIFTPTDAAVLSLDTVEITKCLNEGFILEIPEVLLCRGFWMHLQYGIQKRIIGALKTSKYKDVFKAMMAKAECKPELSELKARILELKALLAG